jgi:hypothetical protein
MSVFLRNWLEQRIRGYEVDGEPCAGTYGQVWLMRAEERNIHPQRFALKTLDPDKLSHALDEQSLRTFEREIRIWLSLPTHQNVLPALGLELAPAPYALRELTPVLPLVRMPHCDTTLEDWIARPADIIGLADRLFALAQTCNGLAWLYRHGIQGHGDLKPANVLVSNLGAKFVLCDGGPFPNKAHPWLIRVADLGWADAWIDLGYSDKAWRPYLAPERFERRVEPVASDIFAVGVIGAELLQGFHPAGQPTEVIAKWKKDKIRKWAAEGPRELSGVKSDELRSILDASLDADPGNRPSPAEIIAVINREIQHEFGSDIVPLLKLWNDDAVSAGGTGETARAAWAAEVIAEMGGPSTNAVLQGLQERIRAIGDPVTLVQAGEWLVAASSRARLLHQTVGSGDLEPLRRLAATARAIVVRFLSTATPSEWEDAWHQKLKTLVTSHRAYEGLIEFVGHAKQISELGSGSDQTREWFEATSPRVAAAYHYWLASSLENCTLRESPNFLAALQEWEECIRLVPSEATFHYMKGRLLQQRLVRRWLEDHNVASAAGHGQAASFKVWCAEQTEQRMSLVVECLGCLRRAADLEPEWMAAARMLQHFTKDDV